MRVLITGGAGFIGSHLVDAHVERGDEVLIIDNLSTGREENVNPRARFEKRDITDDLRAIFQSFRPQVVNHHAAQINVRRSEEDPMFDARVNILGTLNLLLLSKEFQVEQFIFASSGGTVYGETDDLPTREDHPLRPISPYGISKVTGEFYVQTILDGSKWTILRYSNVYGPRQNPLSEAGVIAIFINNILKGKPSIIFGDGNQTRDYVHVFDCVAVNLLALTGPGEIYNIGTGVETSVNQLIRMMREILKVEFDYHHGPPRAGELRRSCLDCTRARNRLGWRPRIKLEEGIERTYQYFKQLS
ncbi:UDP-glucose 4-epimerase [candidate division WOR-3 bacterium]|uniref:UDP-glucose 4-epimerase n=1 Tax=candidate division WOR-3 bacterium TaxID=2052148 RepID=A0A660SJJ3_UNCW3|nr:MAG: UDP-glucose 4-epimerase [candidate division WOR-3 bacterium]